MDLSKVKAWMSSKKGGWVLVVTAILGMLLIYASSHIQKAESVPEQDASAAYVDQLEEKLCRVVSRMTGEDDPEVLVSLESSEEVVYADMLDQSQDRSENTEGDDYQKTQEKSDTKQNYIVVEDADGSQKALVVTTLSPSVRGVVVVTAYADDPTVREEIIQAVTTALNLSSKKVCVVGVNRHEG